MLKLPDALRLVTSLPELIQATLPHSEPKIVDKDTGEVTKAACMGTQKRRSLSLIRFPVVLMSDGEPIGIPYGTFPRLMLAHIISRVHC